MLCYLVCYLLALGSGLLVEVGTRVHGRRDCPPSTRLFDVVDLLPAYPGMSGSWHSNLSIACLKTSTDTFCKSLWFFGNELKSLWPLTLKLVYSSSFTDIRRDGVGLQIWCQYILYRLWSIVHNAVGQSKVTAFEVATSHIVYMILFPKILNFIGIVHTN